LSDPTLRSRKTRSDFAPDATKPRVAAWGLSCFSSYAGTSLCTPWRSSAGTSSQSMELPARPTATASPHSPCTSFPRPDFMGLGFKRSRDVKRTTELRNPVLEVTTTSTATNIIEIPQPAVMAQPKGIGHKNAHRLYQARHLDVFMPAASRVAGENPADP